MLARAESLKYVTSSGRELFKDLDLTLEKGERMAIIGDNGSGKTTLMKILAGELVPGQGHVIRYDHHWYVPQHTGQFDQLSLAQVLGIDPILEALQRIQEGSINPADFETATDNWDLEERVMAAFGEWGLDRQNLFAPFGQLSGGEKTKVYLSGIVIYRPSLIFLDEPTNHLDRATREKLYGLLIRESFGVVMVSHDIRLLELADTIFELESGRHRKYGGNFSFYRQQKSLEREAAERRLADAEKEVRRLEKKQQLSLERKQKEQVRGQKRGLRKGASAVEMHGMQESSEKSVGKLRDVHANNLDAGREKWKELREQFPESETWKLLVPASALHPGKRLIRFEQVNVFYSHGPVFKNPIDLEVRSGERASVTGPNGSGKSTLFRLIAGSKQADTGFVDRVPFLLTCIDQDYSWLDRLMTVYEQVSHHNDSGKLEHELKIWLTRYLFDQISWDKPCSKLSGGELMRLSLCCLAVQKQAPDILLLDEPTNNLDLRSIEILTNHLLKYQGTILVISHDTGFLESLGVRTLIEL